MKCEPYRCSERAENQSHHVVDVSDGTTTGNVGIPMAVLVGDTNGNGSVTASDIGQTKAQSGQPTTAANFRTDVNASGSITASDIGLVKSMSGTRVAALTTLCGFRSNVTGIGRSYVGLHRPHAGTLLRWPESENESYWRESYQMDSPATGHVKMLL